MAKSLEQVQLEKLQAQITIYMGKAPGNLQTLQEGIHAIMRGDQMRCQSCSNILWNPTGGHRQDCPLVLDYLVAFRGEPLDPNNA